MAAGERPLNWGRGDAVSVITGTLIVTDLAEGADPGVYEVDHSADGTFAHSPMPEFVPCAGVVISPCLDGLTGSGFRVIVTATAGSGYGYDYGYGGATPDWILTWTRRGVIAV